MYLAILLAIIFPGLAYAAIDCNDANKVEFYDATPTDPEAIAYTVPNVANRITFVGVGQRSGTQRTMTITGAGATWTEVATPLYYSSIVGVNWYYAVAATAGATTIGVNYNSAPLADLVIVWTCSGVDQSTPFRTPVSATGTSTTPSVTVTGAQSSDVLVDIFAADMSGSTPAEDPTVGTDQTAIHLGNDGAEIRGGASYQNGSAGTVMSWSFSDVSQQWGIMAAALIPASAVSSRRASAPMVLQ